MRQVTIILGLFLFLACDGRPKIHFERVNHDFGFIRQEEQLTTVFSFMNKGTKSLEILNVRAG